MNTEILNTILKSSTDSTDMPIGGIIVYIIIGLLFCALAAFLIWIYFDKKTEWENTRANYEQYKSGSFKGFWGRMRAPIVLFLAVVLLIMGVVFIGIPLFGWTPDANL